MIAPRLLLALCLVALTGCATLRPRADCLERGGAPWHAVDSAHFRLRTNLEPEAARAAALSLERYRRALLIMWGPDFDPPGRVDVILLQNSTQLSEFAPPPYGGWAQPYGDGLLLVMSEQSVALERTMGRGSVQAHELTHYLAGRALLRQPRWLAEGLAGYLDTVELSGNGREATIGKSSPGLHFHVRQRGPLPLSELWEWVDDQGVTPLTIGDRYASAWLWVHYLSNLHEERFVAFQNRLARAEAPRDAWKAEFGDLDPQELERGLLHYQTRGSFAVLRLRLPELDTAMQLRVMTDAEIHVARADILATGPRAAAAPSRRQAVEAEVEQALRADPHSAPALLLRAHLARSPEAQLAAVRRVLALHPKHGGAWALLGQSLPDADATREEKEQALRRALELEPEHTGALNELAWSLVLRKRFADALPLAHRAVRLEPSSAAILDTYAAAAAGVGECAVALSAQQRAVGIANEHTSAEDRKPLLERLEALQRECGQGRAQGATP